MVGYADQLSIAAVSVFGQISTPGVESCCVTTTAVISFNLRCCQGQRMGLIKCVATLEYAAGV